MLDLKTSVHLHKVEILVVIRIHDEFDSSSSNISHRLGSLSRLFGQLLSKFESESWCRRFLDDLLVTTLDRAIPLEKRDVMTLSIREDLNFDV